MSIEAIVNSLIITVIIVDIRNWYLGANSMNLDIKFGDFNPF